MTVPTDVQRLESLHILSDLAHVTGMSLSPVFIRNGEALVLLKLQHSGTAARRHRIAEAWRTLAKGTILEPLKTIVIDSTVDIAFSESWDTMTQPAPEQLPTETPDTPEEPTDPTPPRPDHDLPDTGRDKPDHELPRRDRPERGDKPQPKR